MSRRILHSQNYLYPCQLSTSYQGMNRKRQSLLQGKQQHNFCFYSPMDSYLSRLAMGRQDYELIQLQGRRFSLMQSVRMWQYQQQQRDCILLSNTQQILLVIDKPSSSSSLYNSAQTIMTQKLQNNQQLISNATILQEHNNNFNLVYITKSTTTLNDNNNCQIELNFCQYHSQQQYSKEQQNIFIADSISKSISNPEDLNQSTTSINNKKKLSSGYYSPDINSYSHKQTQKISLPYYSISQPNSFHIYQNINNNIIIFDKLNQTVNLYDIQYHAITSSISCSMNSNNHNNVYMNDNNMDNNDNEDNQQNNINQNNINTLQMQGRKLAILTNNTFIQYDSLAIAKIIDKRASKIVQIRHLNQQLFNNNNREINQQQQQPLYHQHFIKFWNYQQNRTQQHYNYSNTGSSTTNKMEFLINMGNKIVPIDLRFNGNVNNNVNILQSVKNNNQLFEIEQHTMIGNYDIIKDNYSSSTIIAFTTESQHSFRSYVVQQSN